MMKRGLVLEGGGAKGAYQFGCLLALAEHGIQFDAISGASVGALNGALVAYDRLIEGQEYWTNLSPRKVVTPRYRWLPASFLLILYLISYWNHLKKGGPPVTARNLRIMLGYCLSMTAVLGFLPFIEGHPNPFASFWFRVGLGIVGYGVLLTLWSAYWFLRRAGFSLLEPLPIRELVSRIIADQEPRRPLYVTLTRQSVAFDPDRPRILVGKSNDNLEWSAVENEYDFPRYLDLASLAPTDREEALLASAALPLGIFPSVEVDGIVYVDGGVADNLPLEPLIRRERCEELVVIALRPWTEAALKSHWQEKERLTRLEQMPQDKAWQLYFAELTRQGGDRRHAHVFNPLVNLPLLEPAQWPSRIVLICPDKQLGSFLTGTMRFSRQYARCLLQQGYADATRVIEENGLQGD